ncbi:MAG: hypothetical protein LBS19_04295 [Clostridiales bacterium]|nr:hypothetical protein [Clostridiales bacterium]
MAIKDLESAINLYDILLHNHIPVPVSERNDPELEKAAVALHKSISEAKKDEAALMDKLKVEIISAAKRANDDAERQDINRNHTNYGMTTAYANILRHLGHEAEVPVHWDNEDYLRIPEVVIDGEKTQYHNGMPSTAVAPKTSQNEARASAIEQPTAATAIGAITYFTPTGTFDDPDRVETHRELYYDAASFIRDIKRAFKEEFFERWKFEVLTKDANLQNTVYSIEQEAITAMYGTKGEGIAETVAAEQVNPESFVDNKKPEIKTEKPSVKSRLEQAKADVNKRNHPPAVGTKPHGQAL